MVVVICMDILCGTRLTNVRSLLFKIKSHVDVNPKTRQMLNVSYVMTGLDLNERQGALGKAFRRLVAQQVCDCGGTLRNK